MMRIESLSGSPDRAGRYRTVFSDGSVQRFYRQTVEDFALYTGKEMMPDEYSALLASAAKISAKMRAVRIVSASSISKKDLERRLIQKGEDPGCARQAVDWMSDLSLIDDQKTAEQIVSRCAAKGYGLARAKQALYEKRIPKELWEDALSDYPDQSEVILLYLQDHLTEPQDIHQVHKCTDALIRRGHQYASIRRQLEKLSVDMDVISEE